MEVENPLLVEESSLPRGMFHFHVSVSECNIFIFTADSFRLPPVVPAPAQTAPWSAAKAKQ